MIKLAHVFQDTDSKFTAKCDLALLGFFSIGYTTHLCLLLQPAPAVTSICTFDPVTAKKEVERFLFISQSFQIKLVHLLFSAHFRNLLGIEQGYLGMWGQQQLILFWTGRKEWLLAPVLRLPAQPPFLITENRLSFPGALLCRPFWRTPG